MDSAMVATLAKPVANAMSAASVRSSTDGRKAPGAHGSTTIASTIASTPTEPRPR
jgi:hypothetical protein